MPEVRLPVLSADAISEEDDPATLQAFARGLVQRWHELEGVKGRGGEPYNRTDVKAGAEWLLARCAENGVELPDPGRSFLQELAAKAPEKPRDTVRQTRADLEPTYREALAFEAANPGVGGKRIVRHLREAGLAREYEHDVDGLRRSVQRWRKAWHYRANVRLQRCELMGSAVMAFEALKPGATDAEIGRHLNDAGWFTGWDAPGADDLGLLVLAFARRFDRYRQAMRKK